MSRVNLYGACVPVLVIIGLVILGSVVVWSHEGGTAIVPSSLTVKSGSDLEVKVNGLVGTQTATFRLTGMTGKYELGEFPISSDDFTQTLKIPAGLAPGSYRLTVEGGDNNAKVVITIN
jgi:hypothetical protein